MRALGELKPNPRNARKRTKREVQRIADSIKSAGNLQPIVIDENDVILAGHGRLAAAKRLGLELVPTIKAVGLTDAQKRVFTIADNKLTENSGWDRDVLATEFAELSELLEREGLELTATGFDPAEIDAILHDFGTDFPDAEESAPKLQANAVSRRDDLWLLGPHRLMCGDARSAADVGRLMENAKARMAFADAPYNLKIASFQGRGRTKHREFLVASGEQTRDEFTAFLKETAANIAAVCVDGAIVFMCMDWRHMGEMLAAGEAVFSELKNLIVWNKTSSGQGSFYRSQHELIFAWKVGDAPHLNAFGLGAHGRMRANVWTGGTLARRPHRQGRRTTMTRTKDLEEPTSPSAADEAPARDTEPAEEKVGYGRPPVSTRFKPGQSGNPRGPPKGSKSLDQVLRQALDRRVPDLRRGGRHTVRMIELIVEGLVLGAAKRDPRMVRLLLVLMDRYAPSDAPKVDPEEIRAADREILDEFVASFTTALDRNKGES